MYLKIPEFLPSRQSYNINRLGLWGYTKSSGIHEDDGAILFTSNSSKDPIWGIPNMEIHPEVGNFFIFPSTQQHQVYPFRTLDGKGERRSVSLNAEFTNKSEQEFLIKNLTNKKKTDTIVNERDEKRANRQF